MKTCQVTYKWTEGEATNLHWSHDEIQQTKVIVVSTGILFCFLSSIFLLLLVLGKRDLPTLLWGTFFTLLAIYWIFRRKVTNFFILRDFHKKPEANAVIQWSFSETRIAQECAELVSFNADWKILTKIIEVRNGFLLFANSKKVYYWLPFSGFLESNDIEKFKRFAEINQIPLKIVKS